jgi:hypothetical protein
MIPWLKDLLFSKETFLGYVIGLGAAAPQIAAYGTPGTLAEWMAFGSTVLGCGAGAKMVQSAGVGGAK